MKITKSYVREKLDAFLESMHRVFLLGCLLGFIVASVPEGWPKYLASLALFISFLVLYSKENQRRRRDKRFRDQMDEEYRRLLRGSSLGRKL